DDQTSHNQDAVDIDLSRQADWVCLVVQSGCACLQSLQVGCGSCHSNGCVAITAINGHHDHNQGNNHNSEHNDAPYGAVQPFVLLVSFRFLGHLILSMVVLAVSTGSAPSLKISNAALRSAGPKRLTTSSGG